MIDCTRFLALYTEYCDRLLEPETHAQMASHLEGCGACSRYDRVVGAGLAALHALPEITPSPDFLERLDERLASAGALHDSGPGSGAPVGLVVALSIAIAAAAWVPALRTDPPPLRLPAATAHAPYHPRVLPLVFHPGLLPPAPGYTRTAGYRPAAEYSPYSLLGVPDPSARRLELAVGPGN